VTWAEGVSGLVKQQAQVGEPMVICVVAHGRHGCENLQQKKG
jgi:hypothetical protein